MTRPDSILIAARDAGAAAALAPVARAILEEGSRVPVIVAHGKAVAVFERAGLPVLALAEQPVAEQVDSLLARERVRCVLTGTSMRPARDDLFWSGARRAGVPSLAVLDHWCNYAERFTQRVPFDTLPDALAVMDSVARDALVAAGCPGETLRVTGQPYFDDLLVRMGGLDRAHVRHELGVALDRRLVVFASEPQERYYGDTLGYTEDTSLAAVVDALGRVDPSTLLIVKLHPLQNDTAHQAVQVEGLAVEVRVLRAYPATHLVVAADAVFGMTSVFLLEGAIGGRPTLSIRPGGDPDDHFLSRHAGAITSVVDRDLVEPAVTEALAAGIGAPRAADVGAGAVAHILALIGELTASRAPVAAQT
jgi:hypothetical protein